MKKPSQHMFTFHYRYKCSKVFDNTYEATTHLILSTKENDRNDRKPSNCRPMHLFKFYQFSFFGHNTRTFVISNS